MSLQALQRAFQSAVLGGSVDFRERVVGNAAAGAAERLQIYSHARRLRLQEALADDFRGLAAWLGEAQFAALADAYVARYPSRHPSLRWLGRHLATFLADTPPWSGYPWLAEMAAFEWVQGEVFDAADSPVVDTAALATVVAADWPGLRLQVHPALRRLDLAWNVPAVWHALDAGGQPPVPTTSGESQAWLLWRRDLAIHWRSLEPGEAAAIDSWHNGGDFAAVCTALCRHMDGAQVATAAAALLKGWLQAGLVTALQTG